jgi:hypothetical protein
MLSMTRKLTRIVIGLTSLLWTGGVLAQTPTPTPVPAPTAIACSGDPLNLSAGSPVTLIGGVYIRALPDLNAAIAEYTPDRLFATVVSGPVCADGYYWWEVTRQYESPIFRGWVAQGTDRKLFVLPNDPTDAPVVCSPPLAVPLNSAVAVYTGLRVRENPTLTGRIVTVTQPNTTVLVKDGPVCADGFNWWQIETVVLGVTYNGWIVEGYANEERDQTNPAFLDTVPDAGTQPRACGPAAPLPVGGIGILRFNGSPLKTLRGTPTTRGVPLVSLPSGIQLEILGGPYCNEGINWWQVRVYGGSRTVEGYLAEGNWLGRFLGASGEDYDQPAP